MNAEEALRDTEGARPAAGGSREEELRWEAKVFGRYLIGREVAPHLVERYVQAHGALGALLGAGEESRAVAFARRRPRLLPFLDAAAALLDPRGLLRRKLLLMLAVLEASPEYAAEFLPRPQSRTLLVARLAGRGIAAAFKAAAGIPIYLLSKGR